MNHLGMALTALAAVGAITPYVYANPDIDEQRQATLNPDAVSADQLQGESPEANTSAANAPDTRRFDEVHRKQLDSAADAVNERLPENSEEDAILELIVIEI